MKVADLHGAAFITDIYRLLSQMQAITNTVGSKRNISVIARRKTQGLPIGLIGMIPCVFVSIYILKLICYIREYISLQLVMLDIHENNKTAKAYGSFFRFLQVTRTTT